MPTYIFEWTALMVPSNSLFVREVMRLKVYLILLKEGHEITSSCSEIFQGL